MIDYSIKIQRDFKYRQNMDKMHYIEEFCTIRLSGPRGSGHSGAVNDIARLYDAVIVAPTLALGKANFPDWVKICTPRSIDRIRGMSANVVICDNVAELKKDDINALHAMSAGKREFVLVYVG